MFVSFLGFLIRDLLWYIFFLIGGFVTTKSSLKTILSILCILGRIRTAHWKSTMCHYSQSPNSVHELLCWRMYWTHSTQFIQIPKKQNISYQILTGKIYIDWFRVVRYTHRKLWVHLLYPSSLFFTLLFTLHSSLSSLHSSLHSPLLSHLRSSLFTLLSSLISSLSSSLSSSLFALRSSLSFLLSAHITSLFQSILLSVLLVFCLFLLLSLHSFIQFQK
jgi:hypothetical protein